MADEDDDSSSARFDLDHDEAGERVLHIAGEVDLSNATSLRVAVEALAAGDPPRLVLDVRELTFMDSSGLAVLLQHAAKRTVIVRHPQSIIRRLIETTGVKSVLQMEP